MSMWWATLYTSRAGSTVRPGACWPPLSWPSTAAHLQDAHNTTQQHHSKVCEQPASTARPLRQATWKQQPAKSQAGVCTCQYSSSTTAVQQQQYGSRVLSPGLVDGDPVLDAVTEACEAQLGVLDKVVHDLGVEPAVLLNLF